MRICVDNDVKSMIVSNGCDYRVCTACTGPALVPVSVKPPKSTDIKISIGNNFLYISHIQAMHINRVSMDMLYNEDDIK